MNRVLPALAVGLALAATGLPAQADVKGNAYQSANLWPAVGVPLDSSATNQVVCDMSVVGQNHVTLSFPLFQEGPTSTTIVPRKESRGTSRTPTDSELRAAIRNAHRCGLDVTLKPHIEMSGGEWRAHIIGSAAWFEAYTAWMRHYALIAEQEGVDMFVVTTEMRGVTLAAYQSKNPARMKALIGEVRAVFHGRVTLAAHMTSEFLRLDPGVVKLLDAVGVTYYPKTDQEHPTLASLKTQFARDKKNYFDKADERYHGKRILILEGPAFRSVAWKDRNLKGAELKDAHPDEKLQALEYRAAMETLGANHDIGGVDLYRWFNTADAGGPKDTNFSPQNKRAEVEEARAFGGQVTRYMIRLYPSRGAVKGRLTGATTPPLGSYTMWYRRSEGGGRWTQMRNTSASGSYKEAPRIGAWPKGSHLEVRAVDQQGHVVAKTVRAV